MQGFWYFFKNNQRRGPLQANQLVAMVSAGTLLADDLIWTEGYSEWFAVSAVDWLRQYLPPAPEALPPQDDLALLAARSSAPVSYQRPRPGPSQNGLAIAGFVLVFFFPLIGLILCHVAISGMRKNRNMEGYSLAKAGVIIGWVTIGFALLLLLFVFGCFATAVTVGNK